MCSIFRSLSDDALVALSASMEYICAEILELSGKNF